MNQKKIDGQLKVKAGVKAGIVIGSLTADKASIVIGSKIAELGKNPVGIVIGS
jgi:hypothetical protein